MNILIIDDEPKIRNGLTKLLSTHGNLSERNPFHGENRAADGRVHRGNGGD